jgi:hypothetical protein
MAVDPSLRSLVAADLPELVDLYRDAVLSQTHGLYSDRQIQAWAHHAGRYGGLAEALARGVGLASCAAPPDRTIEAFALLDWAPTGLKRLGVENCAYTHELIEPFAKHPVLKRLEVLSFANGVLRPNEVDLLLQHQPAFAHLARLDLSANLLDDTSVETLARAFPNAVFDDQREDYGEDEDRYVAVGE